MEDISLFKLDLRSLYSISIVVFGFNCHVSCATTAAPAAPVVQCMLSSRPGLDDKSAAAAATVQAYVEPEAQ
jgi:hypothetical protein